MSLRLRQVSILAGVLLFGTSCSDTEFFEPTDLDVAPAAITDASLVFDNGDGSVDFTWSAPVNTVRPAGVHNVIWPGVNERGEPLASGIYFVRMIAASGSLTRKVILVR